MLTTTLTLAQILFNNALILRKRSKSFFFSRILFMKGRNEIMSNAKKTIRLILVIAILFCAVGAIITKQKLTKEKYQNVSQIEELKITKTSDEEISCMIDIKGAVKNPGVYATNCTDNVSDVIRLAGGLTDDADTSVTNLAKKVTNEMVIIIYTKEEVKNSNIVDTVVKVVEQECICPNIQNDGCLNNEITDTIGTNKLVNINTATIEELETISGIGEAKAKAIVEYRNNVGKFKTIEDIKNVSGIGASLYEAIKDYITT